MKYFDLKVGFSCNNNCVHCVITDKKATKDLTTEEIKEIINDIPLDTIVGFTGGEATIRKDFIELLKYAKVTGHTTALQTNGAKFSNFDFALEASKYLDNALVAIHSNKKEIHDAIVRTPDMYEKTIQGFKNLLKLGVDVATQTVISKMNMDNLLETYDFIQSISPGISMNMTFPHPNGNAWINRDIVVPRYTELRPIIQKVLKKYSNFIGTEAIPLCYLYPYQDQVYNYDNELLKTTKKPGLDPANKNLTYFDESGKTEDYKLSQLSDKRKGPLCKECIFNDRCVGVWKEYVEIYKDKFDLFPIRKKPVESMHEKQECQTESIEECEDEIDISKLKWGSIILYGPSGQCMNRCTFCSGAHEIVDPEVKWETFIRDADYHLNNGIKMIEISGGDPGEYEKLVEAVQYLKDNGVIKIMLSTHGRTLKDENLVKRLKDAGLTDVRIPLYGSTAEIHNKTVQYEPTPGNAFNDTIQGIKNCAKHDIVTVGHILLNQYNKNDVNNIIQLYLNLTNELMDYIYIGITFIAQLNYSYTKDWYLPIKDLGPYIKDVYNNHPKLPERIWLRFLDIPYCVLGEYTDIIENKFEKYPDLGLHKVEEENRSNISDTVPHYRIKSYFNECETCKYKDICGAIPLNEIKMFGTYGLKGFKE